MLTKTRILIIVAVILTGFALLIACTPTTPQVVETTKIVEATKLVEVQVQSTTIVEATKIVEVTAAPSELWKAEDVTKASGPDQCKPLATLPKKFKQPLK